MRKFCDVIEKSYTVFFYVSAVFLAGMFVTCAYSVFARFLGAPPKWADELIRFLMVFMAFSGAPYLICHRSDLKVDLTDIFFSKKTKLLEITHMIGDFILLGVLIYLIFPTLKISLKNLDTFTTGLEWCQGYIYMVMPVSFFFGTIAQIKNIIKDIILPRVAVSAMGKE